MTDVVATRWKRNVALFLTGQTVSLFGSMIVQYAVMWYVTLETRSGLAVALYAIAAFAPQGVISLFGGVVADRMNRKVLVMVSDASIAAATLVLAFLMLGGLTDLWIILLAVAVRSVGAGFQQPAVQAMIPQLAPEDQLMRINGVFQTISSAMALLAPATAGVVFGIWGIVPVFFIDVVTAVIGIALLALVPVPTLAAIAEKKTGYFEDLVEGMRYISSHAIVRWVLVLFGIIFLLTVAPSFITPLMIARRFGAEVWMLTVLELAFSVGMLLGGVLVATVLAKRSRVGLIVVSSFGFGVFTAGLGVSPNLWVFYAFMFLVGLFVPLFSASSMTLLQETVPLDKQGRVFSYFGIIMAVATPIGTAVFGPLADVVGVELLLVIAGVVTVGVIVVAVLVPSGREAMRAVANHRPLGPDGEETAPAAETDADVRA
ncbi:MFS transporter [Herbiconiux sp. SYSU D00978]|uniref:MFS transporter n=1 Tax=Herbiconiux sp. SYSU D00978 TaxID=2812562 RepID=UPI001A960AFF|nr:MFS transporter [Herbiconiux sp. SYSU D00978]